MLKALPFTKKGFSLVEAILAASIFGLLATALIGAIIYGREGASIATTRNRAVFLADESFEGLRNIRDENFANLTDGAHGLSSSSGRWVLSGTQDVTDAFTRQIEIGTVNQNTKSITTTVTWSGKPGQSSKISIPARLTKWPFALPWVNPSQESSLNARGLDDGLKIQTQGNYVYIVRNDGTPDFMIIDVSTPSSPIPVGSLSLTGAPTNIAITGSLAYITSRNNNQELQIVDISNPTSPFVAGTFNAAGTADALGVQVAGNTAYLARLSSTADELIIIDVTNPASPSLLGSLNLGANSNGVFVSGSFAYVASANNSQELQVVDVSNPASPFIAGSFNLAGTADANTIWGFGNTIVVGQGSRLSTIDVTTPASPSLLGSLEVGGAINDIATDSTNTLAFLATANGNLEFQVADISNLSSPAVFGSLNLSGTANGVAYNPALNRVFVASVSNTEELIVVAPE